MNLDDAIRFASAVHDGQVDKAGEPYIVHPLRVAFLLKEASEDEQIVAVLHDVLEDLPAPIVDALEALTQRLDESYMEYIRRCGENPIARKVKMADLEDNMDLSRLLEVTEADMKRQKKYEKAKKYLLELMA